MLVGIDVGGSKIVGIKLEKGKIIRRIKLEGSNSLEDFIRKICFIIREFKAKRIGIGIPGKIKEKKILFSPNLRFLNNFDFRELERKIKVEIFVENDANCFALGEYYLRKGKFKNLIGITIGTGLGGGIIINGKLWKGYGLAGEIGHMSIRFDGKKCKCGNVGCAEEYLSTRAIERLALKYFKKRLAPLDVFKLAKRSDKRAIEIFEYEGKILGILISNLQNIFHINTFILGGGISKAFEFMKKSMREELKRRCKISEIPKVYLGKNYSVAYGASLLFK
ncbi:MAG: ROK family protein [Candidatus Aenigmarchaeota archaeon]|nr:ROK family protein [Candidatus Aenigmarchaeota archaeon]